MSSPNVYNLLKVVAEHISSQQHAKYADMFKRMSNHEEPMDLAGVRAALSEENAAIDAETLIMIWDFVDIEKEERLDSRGFAIFMHLVDHWRHGKFFFLALSSMTYMTIQCLDVP